jgi:hypothetical protein
MGRKTAAVAPPLPAAARPLTSIMPPALVIAFAAIAFVLANLLLVLGIFSPEKTENPAARFILCLAIALNLSIFLFVLYPQAVRITKVPVINLTVQIVGPAALHIVLLLLLWKLMPEPPTVAERFFIPVHDGQRATHIPPSNVNLTPIGEDFTYYFALDQDNLLAGIYVKFASGRDTYKAKLQIQFHDPVDVIFQRGPGEGSFDTGRPHKP